MSNAGDGGAADGGLQTFLFADLAGYTALTEAHGDEEAADAAADFCEFVRELLADYGAEEVKALGDALLLRLADAGSAVRLGARIVSDYGQRHQALGVRVGIHTGTAVRRGDDWFGSAVNVAARVSDVAGAGEVLMSVASRKAAAAALAGSDVSSRGRHRFKNVAEPVEVFGLSLAPSGAPAGLPVDPVCRMVVDPERAAQRITHAGVEYNFCSATCAEAFAANPGRYAPA